MEEKVKELEKKEKPYQDVREKLMSNVRDSGLTQKEKRNMIMDVLTLSYYKANKMLKIKNDGDDF